MQDREAAVNHLSGRKWRLFNARDERNAHTRSHEFKRMQQPDAPLSKTSILLSPTGYVGAYESTTNIATYAQNLIEEPGLVRTAAKLSAFLHAHDDKLLRKAVLQA